MQSEGCKAARFPRCRAGRVEVKLLIRSVRDYGAEQGAYVVGPAAYASDTNGAWFVCLLHSSHRRHCVSEGCLEDGSAATNGSSGLLASPAWFIYFVGSRAMTW